MLCLLLGLILPLEADVPLMGVDRCALPYTFDQLPGSADPWEKQDEPTMKSWNKFADIIRWESNPSSSSNWYHNGINDIVGFLTDSEISAITGWSWGSAAAVAWTSTSGNCIVETNIVFNGDLDWTTDYNASMDNNPLLYQGALIHELGHSFGLADFDYSGGTTYPSSIGYNTVMNYSYPWIATVGLDDAMTIQAMYPGRSSNLHDIGVYSFYCDAMDNCPKARVNPRTIESGDSITITNIQVANLGNFMETSIEVDIRLVDAFDDSTNYKLGSFSVDSLGSRKNTLVDLEVTVSDDVPDGYYYPTITSDHDSTYLNNNEATVYESIVLGSPDPPSSDDEPDSGDGLSSDDCENIVRGIYEICDHKVQNASGDEIGMYEAYEDCDWGGSSTDWFCLSECYKDSEACDDFLSCASSGCDNPLTSGDDENDEEDDGGICGG
jgi:hypothetical protein